MTRTFFCPASYSADYPNVISVAATDSNGELASFSNYGVGTVQLAAPGVNVYSTLVQRQLRHHSGTSMAAPLVTGTIALVEAAHPSWSMSQVIDAVLDTVTPDPPRGQGRPPAASSTRPPPSPTPTARTSSPPPPTARSTAAPGFASCAIDVQRGDQPRDIHPGPGHPQWSWRHHTAGSDRHCRLPAPTITSSPISFPTQTAAGTYTLTVGPDIQDWYGNDMNQNRNGVNGEATDAFTETIQVQPTARPIFSSPASLPIRSRAPPTTSRSRR